MQLERREDHWLVGVVEGCSTYLSVSSIVRNVQRATRTLDEQAPVLKSTDGHGNVGAVFEISRISVRECELVMCDCNTGPVTIWAMREQEAVDGTNQLWESLRLSRDAIARLATEMTLNEVINLPGTPKNATSTIVQGSRKAFMQKLDKCTFRRVGLGIASGWTGTARAIVGEPNSP